MGKGTGGRGAGKTSAKASARLERLLLVAPYVVNHPGTPLEDLSRLFGVERRDLIDDLNLLFVTGLPPYGPGDLIDVEIDEEGRVWIAMAEYFSRPVRLTRSEAAALYLRGKTLVGAPGLAEAPALAAALEKIESALGPETLGDLAGRVEIGSGAQVAGALAAIRRAVEGSERIEIDYYSAGRGELTSRTIAPEHLFAELGNWYVVAWDDLSDAERLFRVDRIRSAVPTGEPFEPRGLAGQGRALYSKSELDVPVRLLLRPGARWVAEYYEVEGKHERDEGSLEVTLPAKELAWVAKLVLRLGGEALVLEPQELIELVRETAEATLARYRQTATQDPA
jgi:proteasome accessory factor C